MLLLLESMPAVCMPSVLMQILISVNVGWQAVYIYLIKILYCELIKTFGVKNNFWYQKDVILVISILTYTPQMTLKSITWKNRLLSFFPHTKSPHKTPFPLSRLRRDLRNKKDPLSYQDFELHGFIILFPLLEKILMSHTNLPFSYP